MSFGPQEMMRSMGPAGLAVLGFLLLMSIFSIAVMLERYAHLAKARKQSARFAMAARPMLTEGRLPDLLDESLKYRQSHLARVYAAALREYSEYLRMEKVPPQFEDTVRRATEREAELVVQEFKQGLAALASVGATAPFVGLLGTVIGIMNAFFGMARTGQAGIGAVAGGIAEALVNTAVGLFVALPAVWAFNYLHSRIERASVEMSHGGGELIDHLIRNQRKRA